MPAAAQLLAFKFEFEMAFGQSLVRIAIRRPMAAIPDHHGAAAVFAFRDRSLEGVVVDRVIFDADGKPPFGRIEARGGGPRPALHHAIEFQPQIVMEPPRRVLLNDITVPRAPSLMTARLGRDGEFSL